MFPNVASKWSSSSFSARDSSPHLIDLGRIFLRFNETSKSVRRGNQAKANGHIWFGKIAPRGVSGAKKGADDNSNFHVLNILSKKELSD